MHSGGGSIACSNTYLGPLTYETDEVLYGDKVNTSFRLFPILMTDGALFFIPLFLSRKKVTLRGCFVISSLFLHITTCPPTQKTHLNLSYIF
jgi:hypothetical protein